VQFGSRGIWEYETSGREERKLKGKAQEEDEESGGGGGPP